MLARALRAAVIVAEDSDVADPEAVPPSGLAADSVVNLAQTYTMSRERLDSRLGQVGLDTLREIERAIAISLALP